jgi:hypothetical protein
MTSAALTDALLSFSGAPFFVLVNMSTSYFRRYEGTMRESADSSTRRQRYHVLSAAILSNGGNRNFVHMKVMVDAGYLAFPVRENRLRWAGSSAACSRKRPQVAYTVDSTDKERIVDGWRPGTARPLPRSPPPSGGVSVPRRPHQHTASHPAVL